MLAADQVEQAAGCCDQDIETAMGGFDLRAHANAAVNAGLRELQVPAVGSKTFGDLDGQFAGRR